MRGMLDTSHPLAYDTFTATREGIQRYAGT